MTDDAFHLTALDVRRYDFGNALRGYDRARVDQFREQVAEEIERLTRANQELDQKARNFHEQLKSFRDRDKALNDALVSAQQLRGDIREQAEREAQLIVREARTEAERGLTQVREEMRRAQDEMQQLWRIRRGYLAQLRNLVERQLTELIAAEGEPAPPGVQTREGRAEGRAEARGDVRSEARQEPSVAAAIDAFRETPPVVSDAPPRSAPSTPSWLDVVDD